MARYADFAGLYQREQLLGKAVRRQVARPMLMG